jgi:iron complex outermembrane receptor protein
LYQLSISVLSKPRGAFKAEIIPAKPDPDNAGVGKVSEILACFYLLFSKFSSTRTLVYVMEFFKNRYMKYYVIIFITLTFNVKAWAQFSYEGKIIDSKTGRPLAGVSIDVQNDFRRIYSSSDGTFSIKSSKNPVIVQLQALGFKSRIDTLEAGSVNTISLQAFEVFANTVEISSTRAGSQSPFTKSEIDKATLEKQNLGQDLPILLNQSPSVVVNSDAGAGVGYTGIRIRGTDATRINVTINGIPVNDAESQGVFWVNTPDIASSTSSIQVQRGAGASTNGAGAFGASINLSTNEYNENPYAEFHHSAGSFNTFKNTIKVGSGLLGKHFTLDARLSSITSDGYVDRAASNLKSYYLSGAYYGKNTNIRFNHFSGREKTYQAWYGVLQSVMDTNRTYNAAGTEKPGTPYHNEIDNYGQDYYQLFLNQLIVPNLKLNVALHATKGKGYYEQYKASQKFDKYGLPGVSIGTDTLISTDLVRQLWLDNWFYGGIFNLNYTPEKWDITLGGGWNKYDGLHYGKVIWAQYSPHFFNDYEWYRHRSFKTDFNIYLKTQYNPIKKLFLYVDLQLRTVQYQINGFRNNPEIIQNNNYRFFNPKVGISYVFNSRSKIYGSFAIAQKEPNRDDFEAGINQTPKPEMLQNAELGYEFKNRVFSFASTVYFMNYRNQLVLTGQINDVGAYTRTNIDRSYRLGLELEAAVKFLKYFSLGGNITLSRNRVLNFIEYIDNYDTGSQDIISHNETDIAFSPAVISSGILGIHPVKNLSVEFINKYVGRQFLDNTSNRERSLNPFFVSDLRINYSFSYKFLKSIGFHLMLNNIFGAKYAPNGYNYSYIYGGQTFSDNYLYPQARFNWMAGMSVKF